MGKGGGGSSTSTMSTMPKWAKGAHVDLMNSAQDYVYGDKYSYKPYPGERIAGFTDPELGAQGARQQMFDRGDIAGAYGGDMLEGASGLPQGIMGAAGQQFDSNQMQQRMSPYMEGVLAPQLREAEQSFNRRLNQTDAQQVARGGSVGSYRSGLERTLLEGQKAQGLSDIRGAGMQSAFMDAQNQFNADRQSQVQGYTAAGQTAAGLAGAANELGTGSQNRNIQMINELERSGAVQREMTQAELDLAYQDYQTQRNDPKEQMSWLSSILSGVPSGIGTQTTQSAQPGLLSQAASLGLSGAALQQVFSADK